MLNTKRNTLYCVNGARASFKANSAVFSNFPNSNYNQVSFDKMNSGRHKLEAVQVVPRRRSNAPELILAIGSSKEICNKASYKF